MTYSELYRQNPGLCFLTCWSWRVEIGEAVFSHILFSRKRKEKLSDEEIVTIVVANNSHEEFGLLYDRYSEKVYHKCISFVKDLDLAQDLTHDQID